MIVIKIYEFHVLTDSIFHSYVFVLFFFKANMVETCRNNNKNKKKTTSKTVMQHFTSHLPVLCMKSHLNVTKSSEKAIFETTGMSPHVVCPQAVKDG